MTSKLTSLQLKNLSAGYDATSVLSDFSLDVQGGELLALLGPSGCGKTTVLKVIAGLIEPTKGDLFFGDEVFTRIPAERRESAMVFQKPLLFPHLTVAENVAFGLRMRKIPREEASRRVEEALRMVQLEGYGNRRPKELSGGQEQRVSLARALVTGPRVLLLDEPFSALDVGLRAGMRSLVRNLQRRLRITTIFVTHDQEEAVTIADRIALLLNGRPEQIGRPRDFYTFPKTTEAARFFGWKVIDGELRSRRITTPLGSFDIPERNTNEIDGGRASLAFHPSSASLIEPFSANLIDEDNLTEARVVLRGTIESMVELGARVRYTITLNSGHSIDIEENAAAPAHQPGSEVYISVPGEAVRFFSS